MINSHFQLLQNSVFLAGEEGTGQEVLQHRWTIITEALGQVRSSRDLATAVSKYATDDINFSGM